MAVHSKLLPKMVDELGRLQAEIADLQSRANEIREQLIETVSYGEIDGKLFHCTVVESERKTVDYKSLVERLKVPLRTLRRYTTFTPVVTVKLTAR